MNGKQAVSSDEFWNIVEQTYGEIPKIIKLVLNLNGFSSYLSLKGVRYDNIKDFFEALEEEVHEIMNTDFKEDEKYELEQEIIANYQNPSSFRLKPGHRNYILNLMNEIERLSVNEFFAASNTETITMEVQTPAKSQRKSFNKTVKPEMNCIIVRKSNDKSQVILNQADHEYSRDDEEFTEECIEEEYLTDETMDSLVKIEYIPVESQNSSYQNSKAKKKQKRKPSHMYNDEFIMKSINPRRRRVTINKIYPPTEEGTLERFRDLVVQSMNCILPSEKLTQVENVEVLIEKETDTSYAVFCPLCHCRIRLPVVYENNGRYCNYKRSNFERHLRFKHCKDVKSAILAETVTFEEVVVG